MPEQSIARHPQLPVTHGLLIFRLGRSHAVWRSES